MSSIEGVRSASCVSGLVISKNRTRFNKGSVYISSRGSFTVIVKYTRCEERPEETFTCKFLHVKNVINCFKKEEKQ